MITDHAGDRRYVRFESVFSRLDPYHREQVKRAVADPRPALERALLLDPLRPIPHPVLAVIVITFAVPVVGHFGWGSWLVVAGLGTSLAYIKARRNQTVAARRLAPEMLRRHLCGACGYPLGDLRADERGFTACPECGAAWLLPE